MGENIKLSPVIGKIFDFINESEPAKKYIVEMEARKACFDAIERMKIEPPLNIDQATIWTMLVSRKCNVQICNSAWAYYADWLYMQKSSFEPVTEIF